MDHLSDSLSQTYTRADVGKAQNGNILNDCSTIVEFNQLPAFFVKRVTDVIIDDIQGLSRSMMKTGPRDQAGPVMLLWIPHYT